MSPELIPAAWSSGHSSSQDSEQVPALSPLVLVAQDKLDSMRTLRSRAGRRCRAMATVPTGAEDGAGGQRGDWNKEISE